MQPRYKCLILDHDETAVNGTEYLHYPAFRLIMQKLRPGWPVDYSLQDFENICHRPGYFEFCRETLGFTDEERDIEHGIWLEYIKDKTPLFYPGMAELIKDFRALGGKVCVVSHSLASEIERHYRENGIEADLVFGAELPKEFCKPSPYAAYRVMEIFGLEPKDCLVVDDLPTAFEMAKACGADFAGAGWAACIPQEISEYMEANVEHYFKTVEELRAFVLGG